MASVYSTWTYPDVVAAFKRVIDATVGTAGYEQNQKFVEQNDHWQDGCAWVGPTGDARTKAAILKAVERQFTPVDVIGEVLDNVANGLLDKEASVMFDPVTPAKEDTPEAKQQQAEMDTMLRSLSLWWDRRRLWEEAKQAARRSRWSTRGALRIWITPAALVSAGENVKGLPTGLTFDAALANIQVESPDPSSGLVYTDPNTHDVAALFKYATTEGQTTKKSAEIWYVEGDKTVVRVVQENGGADAAKTYPGLPLQKHLPMAQMVASLLIKDSVRRQQNRLNFSETMLVRITETAGFRERYTLNAMPSGQWMTAPPADAPALEVRVDDQGTTWYLHAVPRALGAAITTDLRGITTEDEATGKTVTMTPGVSFAEPTDPTGSIASCEHGRRTILRECKQGHLANDTTGEASGDAYEQARAVFEKDLKGAKGPLEGMMRDLLETVIVLAEAMATTVGGATTSFLDRYRVVVNLHIDSGPPSPSQQQENRENFKVGLLSDETTMSRNGIEDTRAEKAAIGKDPGALVDLRSKQATALKSFTDAGASIVGAAELVGITPEDAKKLLKTDLEDPDVTQ